LDVFGFVNVVKKLIILQQLTKKVWVRILNVIPLIFFNSKSKKFCGDKAFFVSIKRIYCI